MEGRDRHLLGGPLLLRPAPGWRAWGDSGEGRRGGVGREKVREMTDRLGVSRSLQRPPLRSRRVEKGLTRAGVPGAAAGAWLGVRVAGGDASDWLRAKRWCCRSAR